MYFCMPGLEKADLKMCPWSRRQWWCMYLVRLKVLISADLWESWLLPSGVFLLKCKVPCDLQKAPWFKMVASNQWWLLSTISSHGVFWSSWTFKDLGDEVWVRGWHRWWLRSCFNSSVSCLNFNSVLKNIWCWYL